MTHKGEDNQTQDDYFFEIDNIEVSIDEDGWLNKTDLKSILQNIIKSLHSHDLKRNDAFCILLTNNERIKQLNHEFRNKNKATNVLSFPQDEDDYIGDIAIALETIETEAIEQDKNFYHHFTHMLIHGVLHLMGHDHIKECEAEIMESLEVKILADMGIENPYI